MLLRIQQDDKEVDYHVHFMHDPYMSNTRFRKRTVCTVHVGPCDRNKQKACLAVDVVYGIAWCSVKDVFCKATGRKLAFTRAIARFSRSIRAELWKAYFAHAARPQVKSEDVNGKTVDVFAPAEAQAK